MSKTYNLFISHSWTYTDAYDGLCNILDGASNFSYNNYSILKDDPIHDADNKDELYEAIKDILSHCHVVLIMAGKYATFSKWIDKEIKISLEEFQSAKPILGIKPLGKRASIVYRFREL